MSDLISRSKVISALEQLEEHSLTGKMYISNAIYLLEKQPTAYDIDKVVEELESELKKGNIAIDFGEFRLFEIVKQDDVSDDVCEWKDKELYGYYTSCTEFRSCIACKDTYWKYCPYCGKKIKVVEQMDEDELRYCHHDDTDEYHDCLDYMECEECPYYYADLDQESD